jgi:hypothetical protein
MVIGVVRWRKSRVVESDDDGWRSARGLRQQNPTGQRCDFAIYSRLQPGVANAVLSIITIIQGRRGEEEKTRGLAPVGAIDTF